MRLSKDYETVRLRYINVFSQQGVGAGYITLNAMPSATQNQKREEESDYPKAKGFIVGFPFHLFEGQGNKLSFVSGNPPKYPLF